MELLQILKTISLLKGSTNIIDQKKKSADQLLKSEALVNIIPRVGYVEKL